MWRLKSSLICNLLRFDDWMSLPARDNESNNQERILYFASTFECPNTILKGLMRYLAKLISYTGRWIEQDYHLHDTRILISTYESRRLDRHQNQPISWQLYWNNTYMIFHHAGIIWRYWGLYLGPWLGTIADGFAERNVMSFVGIGGRLIIRISRWPEEVLPRQKIIDVNTVSLQ